MDNQTILAKTGSFHAALINTLRNNKEASAYLQVALDEYQVEGDVEIFLMALRNVTEAKGGITKLAQETDLNRQHLYKTLSKTGNPHLNTLSLIIKALGFHLAIQVNPALAYK